MVAKLGNLAGEAFGSTAEVVAFAEQINKQMVLSGASNTAKDAAMLQLTQAMSSGVLRGEELNSILEQTPTIAKTIEEYMGVTTGEMREMASEGAITAEVVKNAMFAAADETNAKFEQMPMTWGQVWTSAQNIALETFQPLLDVVGQFASFIGENMDTAIAVFLRTGRCCSCLLGGSVDCYWCSKYVFRYHFGKPAYVDCGCNWSNSSSYLQMGAVCRWTKGSMANCRR